uniref:FAS1 domain-containing protein n=1 Tax=Chenopodium quinoa TaxID=63459 RepID=A0A803L8A3_CHEQI
MGGRQRGGVEEFGDHVGYSWKRGSVIARPPPAQVQETPQQLQFNSIIDSIVGAGDFSNWANLLSQADPSIFPLTATLFVPEDGAFLAGNSTSPATSFDPLLFSYHIVPRRFTFTELRQFPNGARLPTLLLGKTLLVTNNSAGNFSVNGALLTHPDLFQSSVISVHGIGTVLDYNTSGDDFSSPENFLGRNPSPENMLGGVPSPPLPEFEQDRRGPVVGSPKNVASSAARNLQKLISELLDNM